MKLPFIKKRSAGEHDQLAIILNSIADGVLALDHNLKITLCNRAAAHLTGFAPHEAVGRYYTEVARFVSGVDGSPRDGFVSETLRLGVPVRMSRDTVLLRRDGTQVYVNDGCSPITDDTGAAIGVVIVFRDANREHEIDRSKDEFISITSHQLRSPVTALRWYGEMLLGDKAGPLTSRQADYVREMYHATLRMADFIDDLLDISRIELGSFGGDREEIALRSVADSIVDEFAAEIAHKKRL